MGERRETQGTNWRVREAVGIREARPRPDNGARVVAQLEEKLRRLDRNQQRHTEEEAAK